MYCTKCGNLVAADQKICDVCGDDLFAQRDFGTPSKFNNDMPLSPSTEVAMETPLIVDASNSLSFERDSGVEKDDQKEMIIDVNGCRSEPISIVDNYVMEFPISGPYIHVRVEVEGRTVFNHTFDIQPGHDYSCRLSGSMYKSRGLGFQLSEPDENVSESAPMMIKNGYVGFYSFLFPVYGIYKAITNRYNRIAGIVGAFIGFVFSMIGSIMAMDEGTIGLGFGKAVILEYKPLSFLDFVINLLAGGILSIRMMIYELLNHLV